MKTQSYQSKRLSAQSQIRLSVGQWPRGFTSAVAVPLAITQARYLTPEELDPERVERLVRHQQDLFERLHKTFGVEEALQKALLRRHHSVSMEVNIRQQGQILDLPTLDPQFLSWKNELGYPAFSVYSVDSPVCSIKLNNSPFNDLMFHHLMGGQRLEVYPDIPEVMRSHYIDKLLLEILGNECEAARLSSIEITSRYDGAMPEAVCDKIHTMQKLFDCIFIVASAPEWKRNAVALIDPGDPLVIGVKAGILWLIDSYDLVPVEQVAKQLCLQGEHGDFRKLN